MTYSHNEQQIAQYQETICDLSKQQNECREFMRSISVSKSTSARDTQLIAYFKKHGFIIDADSNVEKACYDCIEQLGSKREQVTRDMHAFEDRHADDVLVEFVVQVLNKDKIGDEKRRFLRYAARTYFETCNAAAKCEAKRQKNV